MSTTNIFVIEEYLAPREIQYKSIQRLTGGTANDVWRIVDESGSSTVAKHAEPYVASNPNIPFPVDRMDFENKALMQIPGQMPTDDLIRVPEVHSYDAGQHVLIMADGGARTLKDAYTDPDFDIQESGRRLGSWLAVLHQKTRTANLGNNATAKAIYRHAYTHTSAAAKNFDLDPALGERINIDYGSLLKTDDDCVCHGDFWPGNVLVSDRGLTIIDWEMVRRGCGATDVGQFAAEAYLLDRFSGSRGLLAAFLLGYRQSGKPAVPFIQRVAIHMGVHLAFWPTVVPWGSSEETRECVVLGNEMMKKATEDNWIQLLELTLVKDLLETDL
ncbi:MAG: hypothetical protein Q9195_007276 [Heterodermia aff. obscurata]